MPMKLSCPLNIWLELSGAGAFSENKIKVIYNRLILGTSISVKEEAKKNRNLRRYCLVCRAPGALERFSYVD